MVTATYTPVTLDTCTLIGETLRLVVVMEVGLQMLQPVYVCKLTALSLY